MTSKMKKSKIRLKGAMGDDLRVFGLIPYKSLSREVLKAEYKVSQFNIELLERLVKLVRCLEKYNEDQYHLYIPKDNIEGPMLIRSLVTGQVYILCPRVEELAKE